MINWDYMITYGGPELFMAFVVVIFTPFFYTHVLKNRKLIAKIAGIVSLWLVAILIAYWDVYQIGKEAERLCREEAGLHVYKTIESDSVMAFQDSADKWLNYGFKYVESVDGKQKIRLSIKDGDVIKENINIFNSPYKIKNTNELINKNFVKERKIVINIINNEVLGEKNSFVIYPGWLDSRLLGMLGFSWSPPRCNGDHPPGKNKKTYPHIIEAFIKPKQLNDRGDL